MWVYHTLFICSYFDGHLEFFHLWAVVNSAAMNTTVQTSFETWLSILLGVFPEMELQKHMVILF